MNTVFSDKLTGILVDSKAITPDALQKAQEEAHANGIRLEKYLVDNKLVPGANMTLALAEYLGMTPIALSHFTPDAELMATLPKDLMLKHSLLPISKLGTCMTVALGDPFDIVAVEELRFLFSGLEIVPLVASEAEIQLLLAKILADKGTDFKMEDIMKTPDGEVEIGTHDDDKDEVNLDEMLQSADEAPVKRMVNMILVDALRSRANGLHLEPLEKKYRLRFRIDGELVERPSLPKNLHSAVVSRIKIMSDLNIAERRIPQDGRFRIHALGKDIDFRVSILPTVHGEKIVLRLLDKSALAPNLASLDLDELSYKAMAHAIAQPHGIILVTGPTGSGKTTTLYSCLQELNTPNVNIITCEDPVEFQLSGINQVHIKTDIGLTFAAALRSILRQDPDICLVGEIRDGETAEISVKAALTGHLVLSTLHTNNAAGAIIRLIDLGIEPFLLASSVILTQAQRLYRKLCPICKKPTELPLNVLKANRIDPEFFSGATVYKSTGCPKCGNLGYRGRAAIMEVLPIGPEIRDLILHNATGAELRKKSHSMGLLSLKQVGMLKVKEGITTVEAMIKVTGGE